MTDHTAPERIWLGLDLGNLAILFALAQRYESAGFHDLNTVDWGSAKSHSSDVEYIRADLLDAAVARIAELEGAKREAEDRIVGRIIYEVVEAYEHSAEERGDADRARMARGISAAIRALIAAERGKP